MISGIPRLLFTCFAVFLHTLYPFCCRLCLFRAFLNVEICYYAGTVSSCRQYLIAGSWLPQVSNNCCVSCRAARGASTNDRPAKGSRKFKLQALRLGSHHLRDDRLIVLVLAAVVMSNRSKRPENRRGIRVSWSSCSVKGEV